MKSDTAMAWDAKAFGCFLVRLVQLFLTLVLLVGVAVGLAFLLDKIDIVRKMADVFAPYASSLPWLLVLLTVALVLCIPGAPTALLAILKRVKKAGPVELFPADDPDVADIVSQRTTVSITKRVLTAEQIRQTENKFQKSLKDVPTDRLKECLQNLHNLVATKNNLVAFHAGSIGAVLLKRGVHVEDSNLFFDASFKRNDEQIVARLISAPQNGLDVTRQAKIMIEHMSSSMIRSFFVHLVFYVVPGEAFDNEALDQIRKLLFNVCNIRLFFYSVSENNAVAPMEEIQ